MILFDLFDLIVFLPDEHVIELWNSKLKISKKYFLKNLLSSSFVSSVYLFSSLLRSGTSIRSHNLLQSFDVEVTTRPQGSISWGLTRPFGLCFKLILNIFASLWFQPHTLIKWLRVTCTRFFVKMVVKQLVVHLSTSIVDHLEEWDVWRRLNCKSIKQEAVAIPT